MAYGLVMQPALTAVLWGVGECGDAVSARAVLPRGPPSKAHFSPGAPPVATPTLRMRAQLLHGGVWAAPGGPRPCTDNGAVRGRYAATRRDGGFGMRDGPVLECGNRPIPSTIHTMEHMCCGMWWQRHCCDSRAPPWLAALMAVMAMSPGGHFRIER